MVCAQLSLFVTSHATELLGDPQVDAGDEDVMWSLAMWEGITSCGYPWMDAILHLRNPVMMIPPKKYQQAMVSDAFEVVQDSVWLSKVVGKPPTGSPVR